MVDDPAGEAAEEPVVSCSIQGGTLSVYEDRIVIDRSRASVHDDKTILLDDVSGVNYAGGLLSGYIQIVQDGLEPATAGRFSKPVDENTLYFARGDRTAVREVRDAILERARG